jgi:cardiolipin synthase
VAKDQITGWVVLPALIILCREVLVSGLREFLAQANVGVPVSRMAKWKTMLQMVALGFLLIGDTADPWVRLVGEVGLWIAAALTIITGYDYLHAGLKYIVAEPPGAGGQTQAGTRLDCRTDPIRPLTAGALFGEPP